MRILQYNPILMSIEPLYKDMCLCAHCNEYVIIGRDCISPLQIWLKMSLNVYFGVCESLVPPLKVAVGPPIKCQCQSLSLFVKLGRICFDHMFA